MVAVDLLFCPLVQPPRVPDVEYAILGHIGDRSKQYVRVADRFLERRRLLIEINRRQLLQAIRSITVPKISRLLTKLADVLIDPVGIGQCASRLARHFNA